MKKAALIKKIIAHLDAERTLFAKAARTARAEATDEQSKAEHKYDTRGLEASYLARGQSRQLAEIEQAIEQFAALPARDFAEGEPVDLGALVEVEGAKGARNFYFIGPRAGGTEVHHDKRDILVLTPASPLGQQLMGRRAGDRLRLELGGSKDEYRVVHVG